MMNLKEKVKLVIINILMIFVFFFVVCFVIEIGFKCLIPISYLNANRFIPSKYADVVYEYKPHISWGNNNEPNFQLNAAGFRDYEFNTVKSPNKIRIICLGDSATFGEGINNVKDTYSKKLAYYLNQQFKNKFEVFNFGVEGYNTHHEFGVLKNKALLYNPDIVILLLNFGDAGFDWIIVKDRKVISHLPKSILGQFIPKNLDEFLMRNSIIYYGLNLRLFLEEEKKSKNANYKLDSIEEYVNQDLLLKDKIYDLDLILKMKSICDKKNIKFVVAIMPWFSNIADKKSIEIAYQAKLEKDLKKHNIDYIDFIAPILYENSDKKFKNSFEYTESLKVSKNDFHPNEKALDKYALETKQYIQKSIYSKRHK